MSVQDLIAELRDLDVRLWLEGEKLRYSAPQDVMTEARLKRLVENKQAVIEWLSRAIDTDSQIAAPIKSVSRKQTIQASFAQERLLFISSLMPESGSYNVPLSLKLTGELNQSALQKSLNAIVARHESLRTSFVTKNDQYIQVIKPQQTVTLAQISLTEYDGNSQNQKLQELIAQERAILFDLSTGPVIRATLIRLSNNEYALLITLHHIVCDGWSLGILFRELSSMYEAYNTGSAVDVSELKIQYADFSVWQRQLLSGVTLERQVNYWCKKLDGHTTLQLPTDFPRPQLQTFEGVQIIKMLPKKLSGDIRQLSNHAGTTLFMTMLASFNVLLYRYCHQDDIVVGTPIANRNRVEIEEIIGFFVNMLVIRTDMSDSPTFETLLQRVKTSALEAYQYQDLPFEKLVEELNAERDLSRNPLFQVSFAMQNAPVDAVQLQGLSIQFLQVDEATTTRFDLEVNIMEREGQLVIVCIYNTDLFRKNTIEKMLGHYQELLKNIVAEPNKNIDSLSVLADKEFNKIVYQWNQTQSSYPRDKTVVELFEQQVIETPEAIAVIYKQQQLSYEALNEKANQLAHYLISRGVKAEVMVGLCLERSLDLIISILAITKAGGVYVPLDADYPQQRLSFMLEDVEAGILLTQSTLLDKLPGFSGCSICIDKQWSEIGNQKLDNLGVDISAKNLIYIMYTSGSTGQPKGVCVEHKSVVRLVKETNYIKMEPADTFLLLAPVSFDASTMEIWGSLLNGSKLVIYPSQHISTDELASVIQQQAITTLFLTTALFNQMVDQHCQAMAGLKQLLTGGEMLSATHAKAMLKHLKDGRLIHVYGPTEGTTYSTYHVIQSDETVSNYTPIGKPISNTTAYILDENQNPVPPGITGELYIGGDGLARGYLNQPELTDEMFSSNPFSENDNARLYRTGDLARFTDDGDIVFIGRADHQIKLRGYRIELGEIETLLSSFGPVTEVYVLLREDDPGDKRLVAYLTLKNKTNNDISVIREYCHNKLPVYMVPSAFVILDSFPITKNGKVDQHALPAPDSERHLKNMFVAAKGQLEVAISDIWKSLLNLDEVGVEDNFFDLGGHSLLLVKLHGRLKEELNAEISMIDLFRYTTIASLARYLGGDESSTSMTEQIKQRIQHRREHNVKDEAIAVIGMAGQFPGSSDIQSFWQNLIDGVESIRFFSDEELSAAGIAEAVFQNPDYVPARGYLDDADLFDAAFFTYSPHEAELIDPQQRLFLETSWHALEHAACDPQTYSGLISVFAGVSMNGYLKNIYSRPELLATAGLEVVISNEKDFLATRVSYKLDLKGPAITLQTACSSSLVTIHEACRHLSDFSCDVALAGGVSVKAPRVGGYVYQEGSIASPDGHCRAFDAQANGTVSGEGVGVVVLKRLKDAIDDNDTIHAVIKGSAINNDGAEKAGFTAPGIQGQINVIAMAQASAEVTADSIDYIETHGTGTSLGDPIEVSALTQAFGTSHEDKHCALGAVKTNIGHLDAAAGVAGFIKTVLSLEHAKIPPSLHYTMANPEIDFERSPFYVNNIARDWPSKTDSPRRAGVSSFGIGGTNAHIILEQAPDIKADPVKTQPDAEAVQQLIILSAKTESALDTKIKQLGDYMQTEDEIRLQDIAYTLQSGRSMLKHRCMLVCNQVDLAAKSLQAKDSENVSMGNGNVAAKKIVFMFSGQGAQYPDMAKDLYLQYEVFRTTVDSCCEILRPHIDINLLDLLYPQTEQLESAAQRLMLTQYAQCSLFVIEYATAKLWMHWGVEPSAMIGHSIGEYVAACLSGVLSLNDVLVLVANRGRLMQAQPSGSMLSVAMPVAEIQALIPDELKQTISIATVNAPTMCVVSGEDRHIELLEQLLQQGEHNARRLHTSHAFHSPMMQAVLEPFARLFDRIKLQTPGIPFVSNLTGEWITDAEAMDADYWGRHLRNTVLFSDGLKTLMQEDFNCFIETGPGNTLATFARQHNIFAANTDDEITILSSIRHPRQLQSDSAFILSSLGQLWLAGQPLDWQQFNLTKQARRIPLPLYPFERKKYWIEPSMQQMRDSALLPVPSEKNKDINDWFYMPSWQRQLPFSDKGNRSDPELVLAKNWLVFIDETGLGEKLVTSLKQSGDQVVIVTPGASYLAESKDRYIASADEQDYVLLFNDIKKMSLNIDGVIYLWAVGKPDKNLFKELDVGFYSPLFILKALTLFLDETSKQEKTTDLWFISDGIQQVTGDEIMYPEKSTLLGVNSVCSKEMPNILSRSIDFTALDPDCNNVETIQQHYSNYLLAEIRSSENANETYHREIAYRGRYRWVKSFEPVYSEKACADIERPDCDNKRLRSQGVYLITGGFGGIGRVLAEYLAKNYQARLILTGRSELPDRDKWEDWLSEHDESDTTCGKILFVRMLEKNGAKVLASSCAADDFEKMEHLLTQAESEFGEIDGVIHSAGVPAGGLIRLKTKQSAADIMAVKIQGALILDELFENDTLDFMLFCSSLTAVLGALGQVDYTAANIFLDSLAAQRQQRGLYTVSVNWDAWSETGMAVSSDLPAEFQAQQQKNLESGIRSEEGVVVFNRVLNQQYSQVIISTTNLELRMKLSSSSDAVEDEPPTSEDSNTIYERPDISSRLVIAETESQKQMAEIWSTLFNIQEIGINDNFFELGGHSLLAVQAVAIIKKKLGVTITIDKFLEIGTVDGLSAHIDALKWVTEDSSDGSINDEDRDEFEL